MYIHQLRDVGVWFWAHHCSRKVALSIVVQLTVGLEQGNLDRSYWLSEDL